MQHSFRQPVRRRKPQGWLFMGVACLVTCWMLMLPGSVSAQTEDRPQSTDSAKAGATVAGAVNDPLLHEAKTRLQHFAKAWDEQKWEQEFRRQRYLRNVADEGWKTRILAIQGFARVGKQGLPLLLESLQSDSVPVRILAAQSLGYLAAHLDAKNLEFLQSRFKTESDAAVRLYLVDAIGMSGRSPNIDWQALTAKERNRDVRKHVNYAQERKATPVDSAVVQTLRRWDPRQMATATLNQPAPDFALKSFDGKTYRLSDYKGKRPVVLVFVYGDT